MKIITQASYKITDIQQFLIQVQSQGNIEFTGRNTIKSLVVGDKTWNVKIFKIPHFMNALVYRYFRKSKAQRSFEYAKILLEKGINTPAPIAFAENNTLLGLTDSYYISEHLDSDLDFRVLKNTPDYPDRANVLQQFTEFTYHLHQQGIYFIDHSPGNTLIVKQNNAQYQFYLVDLNRMKFGVLSYQTRIDNFSRLSLTNDNEMLTIIAEKYAELCQLDAQQVEADILKASHAFIAKRARKRTLMSKYR